MKKDIPEAEPVETIEDEISAVIDANEEKEDEEELEVLEPDDAEAEPAETEVDEVSDDDGEGDESDDEPDDDAGDDDRGESDDDTGEDDDKLEAPEHWAASDREVFNSQPKEAQEFLLARHKAMEGDYTRKSQAIASDKRQFDAITDALAPYQAEFAQAGLDSAGAVRQLASWHNALRTGGQAAVLQLANTYGIDMSVSEDQEYVDPAVQALRNQVSELKHQTTRQEQMAQQEKQQQILNVIQNFATETDSEGNLAHPHFEVLQDDITRLFQSGMASDLPDAYRKALSWRSDLTSTPKPSPSSDKKKDQAKKVAKAKKAATGVKSSGAVSKKRRESMTLEEEIASHF
jgi:hypothetical protein